MKFIQKSLEYRERQADLQNETQELSRLIAIREKLGLPHGDYNLRKQAEAHRYIRKILAILLVAVIFTGCQTQVPSNCIKASRMHRIAKNALKPGKRSGGFFINSHDNTQAFHVAPGKYRTIRNYHLIDSHFIYVP
jgi:hypothetical protein